MIDGKIERGEAVAAVDGECSCGTHNAVLGEDAVVVGVCFAGEYGVDDFGIVSVDSV